MSAQPELNERIIPYSEEGEQATIGGVLTDGALFKRLDFLPPQDFFMLRHQYIWKAFQRIVERGDPIDYLLVIEELKTMDKLAEIGGAAYLTQLVNLTPTSAHTEAYARFVQTRAVRRRMLAACETIKALALDDSKTLPQVLGDLSKIHTDIQGANLGAKEAGINDLVSEIWDFIERRMDNPDTLLGIPTGFKDLDHTLLGYQKTDLIITGAVPGMGKTSLMLSKALNMARKGVRVGFVSMEMEAKQITQRLIALESGINLQAIRSGNLNPLEWQKFVAASGNVSKLPIRIHDHTVSPDSLRALALRWLAEGGLDVLFVDYLQIMSTGGSLPKNANRTQEVGYCARALKNLALELRLPINAAAQLNREVGNRQSKRPLLDDLRESGEIEQAADVVLFIYRDEYYNEATQFPNLAEIIISKHRNGPTGTVSLYWERAVTKFMNAGERTVDLSHI